MGIAKTYRDAHDAGRPDTAYNEATGDTVTGVTTMQQRAIALGYTIQDYSGQCVACDAMGTVTACGRCLPCAVGKGKLKHETAHAAGERRTFAYVKAELARVGMYIARGTDGEYRVYPLRRASEAYYTTSLDDALTTGRINALSINVEHVTMTLALVDPFQPMRHEEEAYGGRLSHGQRREWAALQLASITAYDANLVAKLLEDRAASCTRNAIACRELDAEPTAAYWTGEQEKAASLARQFRDAGK